jgi:hypothetical protein
VQQEAHFQVGGTKVVEELCRMRRMALGGRLEFNDDPSLYEQVRSKHPHNLTFVPDLGTCLAHDVQPSRYNFNGERVGIDGLDETVAERVVDVVESADDPAG